MGKQLQCHCQPLHTARTGGKNKKLQQLSYFLQDCLKVNLECFSILTRLFIVVNLLFFIMVKKIGRKNKSTLFKRVAATHKKLLNYQLTSGDIEEAWRHVTPRDVVDIQRGQFKVNPMMRTPDEYAATHGMLNLVSGGRLRGKKILHLGASNGVYAKYLQNKIGATAIALDINPVFLRKAKKRGTMHTIVASGVHSEHKYFVQKRSGLFAPKIKSTGLPFKTQSLDYIVSEHFLFADFHKELSAEPGFEERPGSIKKSEDALKEYNRILKKGGQIIISFTHQHALPDLKKYRVGFRKSGFLVEHAWDMNFQTVPSKTTGFFLVLRKIANLK